MREYSRDAAGVRQIPMGYFRCGWLPCPCEVCYLLGQHQMKIHKTIIWLTIALSMNAFALNVCTDCKLGDRIVSLSTEAKFNRESPYINRVDVLALYFPVLQDKEYLRQNLFIRNPIGMIYDFIAGYRIEFVPFYNSYPFGIYVDGGISLTSIIINKMPYEVNSGIMIPLAFRKETHYIVFGLNYRNSIDLKNYYDSGYYSENIGVAIGFKTTSYFK